MAYQLAFTLLLWSFLTAAGRLPEIVAMPDKVNNENTANDGNQGAIAFAVVGRTQYAFDLFSARVPESLTPSLTTGLAPESLDFSSLSSDEAPPLLDEGEEMISLKRKPEELRHTNDLSVSYNGHFIPDDSQLAAPLLTANSTCEKGSGSSALLFVSEKNGNVAEIFHSRGSSAPVQLTRGLAFHDRPNFVPGTQRIILASTEEPSGKPRQGWTAVYTLDQDTHTSKRLTPPGLTDYSPAVSPSGAWVAVASTEGHPWQRELKFLPTDIYIFRSSDGSQRHRVAVNGGWPCFGPDDRTIYFHRVDSRGWFGIYKIELPSDHVTRGEPTEAVRVTTPGLHAMTPAAAPSGKFLAVATRRPGSTFRHVELFDLKTKSFLPLTQLISPTAHHYNPFVSPDSRWVGYHRCMTDGGSPLAQDTIGAHLQRLPRETAVDGSFTRGGGGGVPNVEPLRSPTPGLALLRVSGDFPVFSPDGHQIAMVPDVGTEHSGVVVMNLDGSDAHFVFRGAAFGLSWNPVKTDTLYTATGEIFAEESVEVHIVAISGVDSGGPKNIARTQLTKPGTGNNAFPSVSPDGERVVFRSGRTGHKNLYIMDAEKGEEGFLQQLTDGPWTDTMANWSPDGQWIAFSSDRELEGTFELYLVHPDGTGLHKIFSTGPLGRANHPYFRADSQQIVFTSDHAGISSEPVSVPHQFQPYGEIFVINVDGSGLVRLTHDSYENGTPSWGRTFIAPEEVSLEGGELRCSFRDDRFLSAPGDNGNSMAATKGC